MEGADGDASSETSEVAVIASQNEQRKKSTKWDEVVTALERKYFQDEDAAADSLRRSLPEQLYKRLRRVLQMKDEQSDSLSEQDSSEDEDSSQDLRSSLSVQPPTQPTSPLEKQAARNPYLALLRKRRRRAAAWRPLLPTVTGPGAAGLVHHPDSTLAQRAEAVTEAIVREFCEWARSLGDDGAVTERQLAQLFEAGFDDPVARAVKVSVRRLPVVPPGVARAARAPQAELRRALRRQLLSDLRAEAAPLRTVAFGRALPPELRSRPAATRLRDTWLGAARRRAAGAGVFAGPVMRLSSTKAFVKFLKEHPERPRPRCLVAAGFFDDKDDAAGSVAISDSDEESIEIEFSMLEVENASATPQTTGATPQTIDATPQTTGATPQTIDATPQTTGATTQNNGATSQNKDEIPQT